MSEPVKTAPTTQTENYRLPADITLKHAAKMSIVDDKPIMFDYWTASLDNKAIVGVKGASDKILVKSEEEYTSQIVKLFKSGTELIVVTENSIYIVSSDIKSRAVK